MSVRLKSWKMNEKTRKILSESIRFCRELNKVYRQKVSVRQTYYHLFSVGLISLTLRDYQYVSRILTQARLRGYLAFEWIEDRSRHPLWDMLYEDLSSFISYFKNRYRKNTWINQENFVIILIEKEALAPIVYDIASSYNVPVFPTKGFSSWSLFIQDIGLWVENFGKGKRLVVLVLSDLDPSGASIKNDYQHKFDFMVNELGFQQPYVEKIAITIEQVEQFKLPSMKKNYRKKGMLEICELDALDPKVLRTIVKESIERFVDLEQLSRDLQTEEIEKQSLNRL